MSTLAATGRPGGRDLGRATGTAALSAGAINAVLYVIGVATGTFSGFGWFRGDLAEEMMLGPILLVSFLAAAAGVATFGALRRRTPRPYRTFARVADVVLLISLAPLLAMSWPVPQRLFLGVMHALTAGAVLSAVRE